MIPVTSDEYRQYREIMDALIDNAFAKLKWRIGDGDTYHVDLPTHPVLTNTVKFSECDECYGTGFWRGFGAPCSRRCKS